MADRSRVPTGRVARLSRLARAGARGGLSIVVNSSAEKNAERTAELLGSLRGVAAKFGQMASYVDGMVPDEHREVFERSMRKLQDATPASSWESVVEVMTDELGDHPDQFFLHIDREPIASASIGQVHRATLFDGREVAVKVQHPGIDAALEGDLKSATVVESILSVFGTRKFNSHGMVDEIRDRFREELDYTLEARRQKLFARIHRDDPQIHVPEVIEELSSRRLLVSEFVEGDSFYDACERDEATRSAYCATLWRFVYRANLLGGMFNADPHPGNYLFGPDGRVTFLDFGCVQPIPEQRRLTTVRMHAHAGAGAGEIEPFLEAARELLGITQPGLYQELADDYVLRTFTPLIDAPFRIDTAFANSIVRAFKQMVHELRATADDDGFTPLPEGMLFLNRLQFGFFSILGRLNAPCDYRAADRAYIEAAKQPNAPQRVLGLPEH